MWTPPANARMTIAAKSAGIGQVELVTESQCSGGYFAGSIKHLPPGFEVDGSMLVVDGGGGTADLSTLKFDSKRSEGAKALLRLVGRPEGRLCGSELVNQNFLKWLNNKANEDLNGRQYGQHYTGDDGFARICADRDIAVPTGLKQAMDEFERIKVEFETAQEASKYITIRNAEGRDQTWGQILTRSCPLSHHTWKCLLTPQ
ncbi:hypothetical protein LTR27_001564 [Elasticomyces elasticus]|nr:hypothetical protein LTR27_001564 [Elasticomyces elasticus]